MNSYKASHILVSQKFEAEDLLRLLKEGKSFSELAKKYSLCSSSAQGGFLGDIKKGKAHPDFEEATLNLKSGEMTQQPIRTSFGWHIIKREV